MNTHKGFAVPLIIALAVVLIGGAIFYERERPRDPGQDRTLSSIPDPQANGRTSAGDDRSIGDTIAGFLRASRAAASDADVNGVLDTYYTPEAAQHAKAVASKIVPDPGTSSILVQEIRDMPDPSELQYSSTAIVDDFATSTYVFAGTPPVRVNSQALATDQKTFLVVSLQREGGTWLISHISFQVK